MRFSDPLLGTLLLATALALSGCAGASPSDDEEALQSPSVGDDSGAVQGIVTNAELEPIPNAQLALQSGAADPATTDDEGRFAFSEVPAGKHVVFATALGYASIARTVDVEVGQVTQLSIQLEPLSTSEPYAVLDAKEGYIACGTGSGQDGVAGFTQVECGSNDPNQRFLFEYTFADDLKGILFEMTWRPTQALSKDLALMIEKQDCGFTCGDDDIFAQVQGCCYIRIALPVENMTKPDGVQPATDFTQGAGTIQSRTFPAFGQEGSPVTVFTAQEFDIHVEYFYHALPADWATRTNLPE